MLVSGAETFMKDKFYLQFEIDYWHWVLGEMAAEAGKPRSPIAKMIDSAAGVDKIKLKQAKEIIKRISRLKKQFYALEK